MPLADIACTSSLVTRRSVFNDDWFSNLPEDILFNIISYAGGVTMITLRGVKKKWRDAPDGFWIAARRGVYCSNGNDIPWPLTSGEEYFRILSLSSVDHKLLDSYMSHAPWPLNSFTVQPFMYFLQPPGVDKLVDEEKVEIEDSVCVYRNDFKKLIKKNKIIR